MRTLTPPSDLPSTIFSPRIPLLAAAFLLVPSLALACGGLFCNTIPVEQNAERILFEVHGNGEVTATVEVRYGGDASGFSWVVPVPDTPELGVATPSGLALLDTVTVPQIIPPPTVCTQPPIPFGGGQDNNLSTADSAGAEADGGVEVEDLPQVGPYDPEVISSEDASALIDWLVENDYLVTPEMEPFVQSYIDLGYKFLGMKMAPEAGTQDITPIQLTFAADNPMVPIILTSVAAEPEMGILVFIAADSRFEADNFQNLLIDPADVQMNPGTGQNNYYALASWMVDQAGGQAFITELSSDAQTVSDSAQNTFLAVADAAEASDFVQNALANHAVLTRLYTRMSNWEMLADPTFVPSSAGEVTRTIDLSNRPAVEVCAPSAWQQRIPCGDMYCGVGAYCATTEADVDGCLCPTGTVARSISSPLGLGAPVSETVTCQVDDFDLLGSARAEGSGPEDACINRTCGENGDCVDVNGFATCSCDEGYAAVPSGFGDLSCAKVQRTYEPGQILWERGCSCSTSGDPISPEGGLAMALALLPLVSLRRRRRRAS